MTERLVASDLAVLPVDELAIWLVRRLLADHRRSFDKTATLATILKQCGERLPPDRVYAATPGPDDTPHFAKALAEAWAWLVSKGLVAEVLAGIALGQLPITGSYFVTRFGERVAASERPLEWVSAERRLGHKLHPRLEERARRQFVLGEFEAAVLVAMREVEIAVHERTTLPATIVGTDLMNKAFADDGPLCDADAPAAEREGMRALYRAAMSVFKNPASHRRVAIDNPVEAAEVVLLADLLLRMLDRAGT